MSFNPNDINNSITRANYEEYFLLYTDNELSSEEKAMVEAFAEAHPDLKMELELLLDARFTPETINIDKQSLYAGALVEAQTDEALLDYLDNELDEPAKKAVEEKLKAHKGYRAAHGLLLKTKLDASETLPYPNKKELYREAARVRPMTWGLRVAAAVLLIGSLGVVFWMNNGTDGDQLPVAARSEPVVPVIKDSGAPAFTPAPAEEATQQSLAVRETPAAEEKDLPVKKENSVRQPVKTVPYSTTPERTLAQNRPAPAPQQEKPQVAVPSVEQERAIASVNTVDFPAQNNSVETVTNPSADSYNIQNAAAMKPEVPQAEFASSRKTSVRGLLRKATRFIERTTSIDPTNGDDELLIGAVAIKLK